ncbi:MAG: hypothetical protein COX62_04560 [Deltaproteobacteria bacterium CG_4_10_14_0_2_um_filter_43_8]|nr:MAG: hypothetical protein COV43_04575 [Deltaproteobacteria bacterium CG11_big_fil_rev_8_21_14_0_20_42_23]PJA20517.1 MAG: hypothetical protein COX62_04560 [Deltaproteobacteria bacterium CG_4_10_14_0_2_um_filter_43_8]PJC65050.1 MAG: hypothetical protein CO021_00965 [Deltaproteobacteria bacterium CG_4_9_14_0_2_um_filter_42_21]
MNDTKEIVVTEEQSLIDPLEAMQRCEKLYQERLSLAIKATTENDWIAQGDNPYLRESGSQKIAARFGICISDMTIERENIDDENGRYYVYTVTGIATWPAVGRSIQEIGVCSSRDAFFGKNKGILKPVQDVDIANIKKSAVTNFMGRALLKILGLGGLTWDDLGKQGISKKGTATVRYDKGGSKAANTKKTQNAEKKNNSPFWTADYNRKRFIFARVGKHFSQDFLDNFGFKESEKQKGLYYQESNPDLENSLKDEFEAAKDALKNEGSTK